MNQETFNPLTFGLGGHSSTLGGAGGLEGDFGLLSVAKIQHDELPSSKPCNRLFSTYNFIPSLYEEEAHAPFSDGIENLPSSEQEKQLVKDIFFMLSGIQSKFVSVQSIPPNDIVFTVDPRIDPSLRDMALQISKIPGIYYNVVRYIENGSKFEAGLVNQALAAAMNKIIRDYFTLLGQIEAQFSNENLTLQKLWCNLHRSHQTLSILNSITLEIERKNARGGQVLSILHGRCNAIVGDNHAEKLYEALCHDASKPYFRILENWIYKGIIRDPYDEFFISEGVEFRNINGTVDVTDDFWEQRYQTEPNRTPSFLKKMESKILKAGKYLNVIQECGHEIGLYTGGEIKYTILEHLYIEPIEAAYSFASKTLLDLLLQNYDLMSRLESVKHYLLMDQGDFIVQFLDLTENELCKNVGDLNETRLTSLLELALRTSSSSTDPYKDSLKVDLRDIPLRDMIMALTAIGTPLETDMSFSFLANETEINNIPGIEAFSFKYEVNWPVSLVLNQRATLNYQMIFRHLFYCKYVERQLCEAWIEGKSYKKLHLKQNTEISAGLSLLQKMLNFVQNLQYYMGFEVIEPAWHHFTTTMKGVQNIDQVMDAHTCFCSTILDDLMITDTTLLERITILLSSCLRFSKEFKKQRNETPGKKNSSFQIQESKFSECLVSFLRYVSNRLKSPNQSSKVGNIIHRMDFNGYYNEALEKDSSSAL